VGFLWGEWKGVVLTLMLVGVKVVQPAGVEAGRATDDTVHLVPLLQQQLRPEHAFCEKMCGVYNYRTHKYDPSCPVMPVSQRK